MKKIILLFLIICLPVFAGNIPAPPTLKDEATAEQQYLKKISDNWNNIEIVTTNPDGNRTGRNGDMVRLDSGGNYYLEICISSPTGTVWRGVQLTDIP